MRIVLTLTHKETKKFMRKVKHNRIHRKALKQNGVCYAIVDGQDYFIEDIDLIKRRFRLLNGD